MKPRKAMKNKSIVIYLLAVLCALSVVVMAVALSMRKERQAEFVPPEFDPSAEMGEPTVPKELGWSEIYSDGMSYKAYLCGRLLLNGKTADVFFYNEADNDVWLKLRIYSQDGKILGETGLIKPGEYIKTITFDTVPRDGESVKMKIMSYEPETYYSEGSVVLNTTVRIGGWK